MAGRPQYRESGLSCRPAVLPPANFIMRFRDDVQRAITRLLIVY